MEKELNIILVDDHTLFRTGLRTLLDSSPGFRVAAEYGNGLDFVNGFREVDADVVLLDIEMPLMNGIQAAEEAIKLNPQTKIITLSMYGDEDYYFKMVSLGVKGFILKNSELREVEAAIKAVSEGGSYFSQELLFNLVSNLKTVPGPEVAEENGGELSSREKEILLHICQGKSNNEIADSLFISKRTVDNHRFNIMSKTGCKNTANLVVYAIKNKLVEI